MFTVTHQWKDGSERLYSARQVHVNRKPAQYSSDELGEGVWLFGTWGNEEVGPVRLTTGKVFVMNEHGSTVAVFDAGIIGANVPAEANIERQAA